MKKIIFIIAFLFLSKGFAILSPYYQSIKEIDTILSDKKLYDEFGSSEAITDIKKVKEGYVISSQKYTLLVEVIYIPQKIIGPAKFELKFNEKKKNSSYPIY